MKEQFLNQIEMNPHDDATKLIYADWLEEQGDFEAEAWRWIVTNEFYPFPRGLVWVIWFRHTRAPLGSKERHHWITHIVFDRLEKGNMPKDVKPHMEIGTWKQYENIIDAYIDLAEAYVKAMVRLS